MAKRTTLEQKAAREAAATHSNDMGQAVEEYQRLMKRPGETVADNLEDAKAEFLQTLPVYRHPLDSLSETIIFFGYRLYSDPENFVTAGGPEFDALNKITDPNKIVFVRQALMDGIKYKGEADKHKKRSEEYKAFIDSAFKAYQVAKAAGQSQERAKTAAVQALGITKGRREQNFKEFLNIYRDYAYLVRKKGLSRKNALELVHHEYSREATQLSATRNRLLEVVALIKEDQPSARKKTPIIGPNPENYLAGLIGGHNE